VTGHFKQYNLLVETEDDDFTKATRILVTANVDSIDTNNAQRDTHLKSPDFFGSEQYPQLRFEGKGFEKQKDHYLLHGELTIRDITKPVQFRVNFEGVVDDLWGQVRAGVTVDGKIKRKDFGLNWNQITEAGQVIVSNEIRLHGDIQLVKQIEQATKIKTEVVKELNPAYTRHELIL
jgi:polyisoprenoid-binding protein YceI